MDELNQNVPAEETAEQERAMKCDNNKESNQKNKTPALFKAGIAIMCATSALSIGAIGACGFLGYKLYKNQKNNDNTKPENSMGSVVTNKQDTITISEDGYWVINGVKTSTKAKAENGTNGLSIVSATIVPADDWGITTQIMFILSDGTPIYTSPRTQVMSEHFYEASSMSKFIELRTLGVQKIKLINDITLSSALNVTDDVVIDLNKHTLTYSATNPMTVAENCSLTLKDGSVEFTGETGVSVAGANAELEFNKVNIAASAVVAETLEENASITLDRCTFQKYQAEPIFGSSPAARQSIGSLFVVKGSNANLEIKASKFATNRAIISASENAETINVKIAETELNTTAPVLDIDTDVVVPTLNVDKETINHSTITELNTTPITSGSFNVDPTELGATLEGASFNVNGSSVIAADLADLISKVESGSTITLTRNEVLTSGIVITGKTLTLNLNEYVISAPELTDFAVIRVDGTGNLTINSSEYGGIRSASQMNDYSMAVWASNGGQVTINGGSFENVGAKSVEDDGVTPNNNELIYVSGTGSLITINNGNFAGNIMNPVHGTKYTLNKSDGCASDIVVNGGQFVNYNPFNSRSENPTENFLGENKLVASYAIPGMDMIPGETMRMYLVTDSSNFAEFVANGIVGEYEDWDEQEQRPILIQVIADQIYLNGNVEMTKGVVVNRELTINLGNSTITAPASASTALIRVDANGYLIIEGDGTINSASNANDYSIAVWASNGGQVTINGGTFTNVGAKDFEDNGVTPNNNELIYVSGTGSLITINNATIIGNSENKTWGTRYTLNKQDNCDSTIVVNGGTFVDYDPTMSKSENPIANFVTKDYFVYKVGNAYTVAPETELLNIINNNAGATIILTSSYVINDEVTLNLNGCTITAPHSASTALFLVESTGVLTINGEGTINSASDSNDYSMAIWAYNGGQVVINGGTFTNLGGRDYEVDEKGNLIIKDNKANNNELIYVSGSGSLITINAGTFIGNSENRKWGTRYTLNKQDKCASDIVVNGGTFVDYDPSMSKSENPIANFVSKGNLVYKVGNTYTVAPASELVNVINNNAGATITLFEKFIVNSEVTINLNGCTITAPHSASTALFSVESTGVLTINGEGTINSASDSNDYSMAIWAYNGGQVVINGGTFTNLGGRDYEVDEKGNLIIEDKKANNNELIYVSGSGSLITINAGTFIGNSENRKWGTRYTLNKQDKCASDIVVNGGTFVDYDPTMSKSENPIANFVAEGYKVVVDGNNYTVVAE